MSIVERLDEIEALVSVASPGPWIYSTSDERIRTAIRALVAGYRAVLALHEPTGTWLTEDGGYRCDECGAPLTDGAPDCSTVLAIKAVLGGVS